MQLHKVVKVHFLSSHPNKLLFFLVKYIAKNYQNLHIERIQGKRNFYKMFFSSFTHKNQNSILKQNKNTASPSNLCDQTIFHKIIISSSMFSSSIIKKSTFVPPLIAFILNHHLCISTNQSTLLISYTQIKIPKTTIANQIQHFFQVLEPPKRGGKNIL